MKIRMRSFGLVVVLVLAGCTKPEPQPVASAEEPQPAPSPEPAQHPVSVALQATIATPDDPTARIANCKLPEDLDRRISETKKEFDQLRKKYSDDHPEMVRIRRRLDALVQEGLQQCVEQIQVESPGHI